MAYGQTGSGKTYTMGNEADYDEINKSSSHGLLPRFISDMFASLENQRHKQQVENKSKGSREETQLMEFELSASFLEVYGEDIHDLLDEGRRPLPLREDSNGEIIVVGLTKQVVSDTKQALSVLHRGTLHRTTASTLMNNSSSRSHAVFTVYFKKIERGSDGVDVSTTSRFTFVALAGSERMKRTGAEGDRAKEGIKINQGLFALGNVINALADDERLSKGEKIHVPVRALSGKIF